MKEINDIIQAYEKAILENKAMALATVVHVEGSSYRRPGARMLVTDDGVLTGAISGGCLEGDALRKALLAISQQKNKLVTYDTTDDNDNKLGVQLGCNGIVHILFEPIDTNNDNHPIALLKQIVSTRCDMVLFTLFSLESKRNDHIGTCVLFQNEEVLYSAKENQICAISFEKLAYLVLETRTSFFCNFSIENNIITVFTELIEPAIHLVIVGAGNDTMSLCEMAGILGWQITIADGRAGHATKERFPKANKILLCKADELLQYITLDARTAFVLMTHNYNYDLNLLACLLDKNKGTYIGVLGPKKKLYKMYEEIQHHTPISDLKKETIYGPLGLEIGAETSEEIALSVLAEIKAVMASKKGAFLRDKTEPIHNRSFQNISNQK